MRTVCRCLSIACLAALPLTAQNPAPDGVLQAELAFARLADEKGIRTAFLAWLTDDASVFTPRMNTARAQYGPEPGDPGHLAWYPEAMGISGSGELAWSFGPWAYAVKKGEKTLVNGHFLSLWRRQADNRWKVEADIGIPHAAPGRTFDPFATWEVPSTNGNPPGKGVDVAPLIRQKETELAAAWIERGGLALLPCLAKGARILRPGSLPAQASVEIQNLLERDHSGSGWAPNRVQVAKSGDLAWTCGESGPDDHGSKASFLRIWTLEDGSWRVLFDVRLPLPAPSG